MATKSSALSGDLWGGAAAMLVAVPSAIAFGVTILSPLGGGFAAQGALAGVLGAAVVGLVAASLGGTPRLISAPCAPAAAVLSAFAIQAVASGASAQSALVMLALVGLVCGVLQIAFGTIGLGRLIKYMPYPVVSGYMIGVGLIIIMSQIPKFLGVPKGQALWQSLISPSSWTIQAIIIGAVTAAAMTLAPRLTRAVPGPVIGLAGGLAAYFGIAATDPSLLSVENNSLVVGTLPVSASGLLELTMARGRSVMELGITALREVLIPGATLAVLLSIDTLKTCVVTDALTGARHQSNRELVGQGCANVAAALVGGVQGAGTMGATMVNISGGGSTRRSGMTEGALALAALLVLAPLIAWIPVASLAAILIVIGVRMIDWDSLHLLRSRSTVLDFVVILSVVAVAETVGLIAASAVGVGLAMVLFIREQIRGTVVHRKADGSHMRSKQMRLPDEMAILTKRGDRTVILELQGSLFFGTTDQLYTVLEPELDPRTYVILDFRRVQSMDLTAAHMLERIEDALAERNTYLLFSCLPKQVPSGQDMSRYFDEVGLVRPDRRALSFADLDAALEWVENRILEEARLEHDAERPLQLEEIELFRGRKAETLAALEARMERRAVKDGEALFRHGDPGAELFLIRRGKVRILLPVGEKQGHHLATFGRGDFFGEMSFLDGEPRSADAIAASDTDLFVLPRAEFDALALEHRALAANLLEGLARMLAIRLRYANAEVRLLQVS
jgi:SulP family sulfate permease